MYNAGSSQSWALEGCQYPAGSVDIVRLPDPIPCRGDVGMWQLPEDVSDSIDEQLAGGYPA